MAVACGDEAKAAATPSGRLGDVLFWFMLLLGFAVLAPTMVLPAWLEYRAAIELKKLRAQQLAEHQAELLRVRKQREYLETDDAYALRLVRRTFNLDIPGVIRVPVELPAEAPEPPAPPSPETTEETGPPAELSALLDTLLARYPLAQIFILPRTRPPLLAIGIGLIASAVILVGAPTQVCRSGKNR
jgi:hypothetical protein